MRGIFSNSKLNIAVVFIGVAIAAYYYWNAQKNSEAANSNDAELNPAISPQTLSSLKKRGISLEAYFRYVGMSDEQIHAAMQYEKEFAEREKAQAAAKSAKTNEDDDDDAYKAAAPLPLAKAGIIAAWVTGASAATSSPNSSVNPASMPATGAAQRQFTSDSLSIIDNLRSRHSSTASEASSPNASFGSFTPSERAAIATEQEQQAQPTVTAAQPAAIPAATATGWGLSNLLSWLRRSSQPAASAAPTNNQQPHTLGLTA